ncbi:MAG: hypothetical protein C0485_18420 [Pirellula sp.]|nr:hypothetical protein [Pirellula sp.]
MSVDVLNTIQEWFAQSGDKSEFWRCEPTDAFTVIGPSSESADTIYVYSTKPLCVTAAKREHREFDGLGFIGRYGLPRAKDVEWTGRLLDGRRMVFLGDMDPVDLMVFAWWRASLEPDQVAYLGVSDHYLQRLEIVIPENYTMELSPCEQRAMPVLEAVCPDYRSLVGPGGAALLDGGMKIELEAVATRLGPPGRLLLPAVG